jgi:hypothetical protein
MGRYTEECADLAGTAVVAKRQFAQPNSTKTRWFG